MALTTAVVAAKSGRGSERFQADAPVERKAFGVGRRAREDRPLFGEEPRPGPRLRDRPACVR